LSQGPEQERVASPAGGDKVCVAGWHEATVGDGPCNGQCRRAGSAGRERGQCVAASNNGEPC